MDVEYVQPASVADVVAALSRWGRRARVLGGGTDFVIGLIDHKLEPECIISLRKLAQADEIVATPGQGLRLGALVTYSQVMASPVMRERYPMLAQMAGTVGAVQIRNRGTLVGNICHGSPAADSIPPLIAHEAVAVVAGPRGERRVPVAEFFLGPGRTVLEPDEFVSELWLPEPPARNGAYYYKQGLRRAMHISLLSAAVVVALRPGDNVCTHCRLALGAVNAFPRRAPEAEALLEGRTPTAELLQQVAVAASRVATPISDVRAPADYRAAMVPVVTLRALQFALRMAVGGER